MSLVPANTTRLAALLSAALAFCALACRSPSAPSERSLRAEGAPAEPLATLLWRAGRPAQPGLAATRALEIEAERERALAVLRSGLSRAHEQELATRLAETGGDDEAWCAAASAAASLERYDLAPLLAAALEPPASPRRGVAARNGLHRLYGRWFRRTSEVEPYLASVRAGGGTRLLLESSRWEEERSRERLLADLAHRPSGAVAWLADPDPAVRSGAARVLARSFRRESADADATLAALVAHLEGEQDPAPFHDGLAACLEPLERAGDAQPSSARLRALLVEIARTEGDARSLSAARALARIPWRTDGARDLGHVLTGVEALGAMLRGLSAADRRRGVNDPDPLVAALAALRELCERANAAALGRELAASSAREAPFAILCDPAQDDAVRAAAAAALGPLARALDAPRLAAVLADPQVAPGVKHALLGSLRAILPALEPSARGAGELFAAVAELTGAADPDLRKKALGLCSDPRLEPLVRGVDPAFLVERLGREESREARLELLALIERFGGPELLDPVLALARFDELCAEPASLDALARALLSLSRDDAAARAAERVARASAEETSLARHRHALALVASLDDSAAFGLAPEQHRAIAGWVWRVVGAGLSPRELAPGGLAFERRVLDVHLPRGEAGRDDEGGGELDPFQRAHLAALLRADVFLAGGGGARGSKQEVEAAFDGAHGLAPSDERRLLVLRDRARFRAAANECVKALSDYRRVLEAPATSATLLGIPDLRSAVELLGRLDEPGGGNSESAGEASALLAEIVSRPGWRSEPASVRMQDLRDWAEAAVGSGELALLREVEGALADLPLTQLETQAEREPAPLWLGLTREAGWFQELLDLRARVRLRVRELEARGAGGPSPRG